MEQLIAEVEAFAKEIGRSPSTVWQKATGHGGTAWPKIKDGASCTMRVAERVRAYIARQKADALCAGD